MKFNIKHNFDFSLSDLLKAREYRYSNLDKFPELKNIELISQEERGKTYYQKSKIHLNESIPPILQPFLKDLCLLDDSEFDSENHVHKFKVHPATNKSIFLINGLSKYKSLNDNASVRDYEVEIKSSILFVSSVIENIICDIYKKNLEKDKITMINYLKNKKNT